MKRTDKSCPTETSAAEEVGMTAVLVKREGNASLTEEEQQRWGEAAIETFDDISFEAKPAGTRSRKGIDSSEGTLKRQPQNGEVDEKQNEARNKRQRGDAEV